MLKTILVGTCISKAEEVTFKNDELSRLRFLVQHNENGNSTVFPCYIAYETDEHKSDIQSMITENSILSVVGRKEADIIGDRKTGFKTSSYIIVEEVSNYTQEEYPVPEQNKTRELKPVNSKVSNKQTNTNENE